MPLPLSGHMRIQHVRTQGSVTEIAGSPLTMGACQYGVLSGEDGALRYETHRVPVAAWAARRGRSEEALLEKWKSGGAFFASYFASVEGETGADHTHWESTKK